jgi:dTMP kinase
MMPKGLLISFEGLDGSGKTTQVNLLGLWLAERNINFRLTREPGGTTLGKAIRKLILEPPEDLDATAEAFLFQADRAQHFAKVVLPEIKRGYLVITDRCFDSSIAYQGRLGIEFIDYLSRAAMRLRVPRLTILLDIPAEQVRAHKNGQDRIETG